MGDLSAEEYGRLSDQKADDWRHISEVNPTLFGVAGAIFAAGVAARDASVLALSPLPLFIGVFHMIRSAKLQMQMITYIGLRTPPTAGMWERDIARVLHPVWKAREMHGVGRWIGFVSRASAWNTWLAIAACTDLLVNLTGTLADYDGAPLASVVGAFVGLIVSGLLIVQAHGIEKDRKMWVAAWTEDENGGTAEDVTRAARLARYGK